MGFTSVPVKGQVKYANGEAVSAGTVVFTLPRAITNGGSVRSTPFSFDLEGGVIPNGSVVYALDDSGTYPDVSDGYTVTVVIDEITYRYQSQYARAASRAVDLGVVTLPFSPAGSGMGGGVPDDGSVTNVKVATNANISADKLADGTSKKVMTAAERTKLTGIASGATANSTDADLLDRENHTGTQPADTITGLADVATSGAYEDLSGIPELATVAVSGDYDDLSGRPDIAGIESDVSDLQSDLAALTQIVVLSESEYEALSPPDPDTVYVVTP